MKMKKVVWMMIVAVVLGAGAVVYSQVDQKTASSQSKPVYYCSMHPTYTSDRPGNCPICNMKLILREDVSNENPAGHALGLSSKQKPVSSCPMRSEEKSDKPGQCSKC